MEYLEFTEDRKEMCKIGKRILADKSDIYTEKMLGILKETIAKNMPHATNKELEDMLYCCIYEYWAYGNSVDEEFYYDFIHKRHEDKIKYMTMRWRLKYIWHINRREDEHTLTDKMEAYELLKDYYGREMIQISGDRTKEFSYFSDFVKRNTSFVVKPKSLSCGVGVFRVDSSDWSSIDSLYDDLVNNVSEYEEQTTWGGKQTVVLEEIIEQADVLKRIHPDSVNGVRVTTVRVNDEVVLYHPWLKIGAGGAFVTSAVFGAMDACINPDTGIVETKGFKENGEKYQFHPDTGIEILGFQISRWDELVSMAKELAMKFNTIRYIGWDFVLTNAGWKIMEANFAGDFMWQMCYEKGMREEFEKLIGWRSEKKFWWE